MLFVNPTFFHAARVPEGPNKFAAPAPQPCLLPFILFESSCFDRICKPRNNAKLTVIPSQRRNRPGSGKRREQDFF